MLLLALVLSANSRAGVVINEFMAASSERRLSWDDRGMPHLGSGVQWTEPGFDAQSWSNGFLPAGYGFSGLALNLTTLMKDKAPSLYLRKEFQVAAEMAVSTDTLTLLVQINDGFVAYLNGREVARANCGPTNHFMFAGQPAYNVSASTTVIRFPLGPASKWLTTGTNVLALQACNAEQPSTTSNPQQITSHIPTPEFLINAGLQLTPLDTNTASSDLVPLGTAGGYWRYFVGRAEPSGGVVDMGLVTRAFTPPSGEEDDYEQPAAFGDWLELYNDGPAPVSLGGWTLTDDPALPAKWRFPATASLAAGAYLVVMCDQRDEANAPAGPATRLHTNFKLSDTGEYLALFDSAGTVVDSLPGGYPPQLTSCSYGRNPTNSAAFGYFTIATPGTNNAGPFYSARVEPPQFQDSMGAAVPGGLYLNQSPALWLRHANLDAVIKFTLNGSEPTEFNGTVFTNGLLLSQPNEKYGIVVRARAFLPGLLPSEVITHTYLLRQPAYLKKAPVLLLTGDAGRSFYAPDGLLAIVGGAFVSDIWMANGPASYDNALGAGIPFEREAHLEYFFPAGYYPGGQVPFRADAGLRVSSSPWSRPRLRMTSAATSSPWPTSDSTQKPSFNVYFAGDYGPGKLDYPLFTNYPAQEFQHLRLRAGKNDIRNPFITDELIRRLWLDMGHVGARGLFCSLYVNGIYKGVYNPCERLREPFFQAHYNSQLGWDVNYIWSWVDGDSVAYQQLLTALNRDLTNPVYWQAVTNRLDIDNAADYYLLNIYAAMWDWPNNNFVFARERSNGPNSRFRFVVWDAEGGFNVVGYGKPVSYNTLTSDLLVPSTDSKYNTPVTRIFRRLATSPEFRLRFADHVNLRMFNGGILDDRDPDGAGPLGSHFKAVQDQLAREAGDLIRYNSGTVLNLTAYTSWASPAGGRRTYLLGASPGRRMLRDAGFWPVTEPPVFNQHGGAVPPGFDLEMTSSVAVSGQTSTICFTLDGSDPRLVGGARNSSAQLYTGPVPLAGLVTVKARAVNDQTGEWSPLTEASFEVGTVAASSTNLVVAELMYHPPASSVGESAAGFSNAEDFEFVRLLNITDRPVELARVRFSVGITYDFASGSVQYLNPGASVLIVKDKGAFHARYGHGYDSLIAGEYSGNLSNGGERLQLLGTNSVVIRDFTYGDSAPWPTTADGNGPSLLLRDPWSNPDPGQALNWLTSAVPGGLPGGGTPSQSYAAWRALYFDSSAATNNAVSSMSADPDQDGLANFVEYAFGLDPHNPSDRPQVIAAIEPVLNDQYLTVTMRSSPGAVEATWTWELSDDCATWYQDDNAFQLLETRLSVDGTESSTYWYSVPVAQQTAQFVRLRVSSPP